MTNRSPVAVFFLTLITCGIYPIFWFYSTSEEMTKKGVELPGFIQFFIPILGLLWLLKYCEGVEKVTNGAMTKMNAFLMIFLLGAIGMALIQGKFNEVK